MSDKASEHCANKKRGHPCQLRFWNRANGWEVDCISHLSIEDKCVITCKVENGRAFTSSELRDELKAVAEAAIKFSRTYKPTAQTPEIWREVAAFEAWYDQHLKERQ